MLRFFKSSEKEWGRHLESATLAQREGRAEDAEREFETALQLAAELPEDDPRRQRTLALAADFHLSHAQPDAALRCYDQLLKWTERKNGAEDPAVARVLSQMAAAHEGQGSFGRAEMLYRRALRIFESSVGEEHRRTGLVAGALANVLRLQEEWSEAIHHYQTALEIERNVAVGDTATLLRLYLQLSHVYASLGRETELEETYVQASNLAQKAHGFDPLEAVTVLQRLASFYQHRQRLPEAVQQYELILEIQRRNLGGRHPAVATTLQNLGRIAELQGEVPEAIECYSLAAGILAGGVSRTEAIHHAFALCDWGRTLYRGRQLDQARTVYTDAIERSRAALPADHPNLATPLTGMALLLEEQGEPDQAEMLANEALELCGSTGSQPHPNTVQLLELMARIAERRQDWPLSEALTIALIKAEEALQRPNPLRDMARLRQLSAIEVNLGKFHEALLHVDDAMNLLRYNPALSERPELRELELERKQILLLNPAPEK